MQSESLLSESEPEYFKFALGCLIGSVRISTYYYVIHPTILALASARTRLSLSIGTSPFHISYAGRVRAIFIFSLISLGAYVMMHVNSMNALFTNVTVLFAALTIVPIFILGFNKAKVGDIFSNRFTSTLYFTSKISGVLGCAFALAAAASSGKVTETYVLAFGLVFATALTAWTVSARVTGRFYGLAGIGRPA